MSTRPIALALFALALAPRLLALARLHQTPLASPPDGDPRFYLDWACRILAGQWTDGQAFYGLPGYAFLLATLLALTGGSLLAVGIVQAIADSLVAPMILSIARLAFPPDRARGTPVDGRHGAAPGAVVGILAALLWAFYTPAIAFAILPMPVCWLVLSFWLCVRILLGRRMFGLPDSHWGHHLALGALIGLTATISAQILALLPLALLLVWTPRHPGKPPDPAAAHPARDALARFSLSLALLLGAAVGTGPCWAHNLFVAREPVLLSAHSGLNLYVGNNPNADGYPRMPDGMRQDQAGSLADSIRFAERAEGRALRRFEVSRHWAARARAYAREHPGDWLALMARKTSHLINAFEFDDIGLLDGMRDRGIAPPGIAFWIVALLGLPGLIVALRRHPDSRPLAGALALFALALLPMSITERYRLPLAPGLMLFGAALLVDAAGWVRARRWGALAVALALVAATGAAILPPRADHPIRLVGLYNTALTVNQLGDARSAETLLRRALAIAPSDAGSNAALGDLLLQRAQPSEALAHYRRALGSGGDDARVLHNIGIAEIALGRPAAAADALRRAARLRPDPDTLELLSRCERRGGGARDGSPSPAAP